MTYPHSHEFFADKQQQHERRTWFVLALTVATMAAEILAGMLTGSMALLADGWNMASHAVAMGIAALAYYLARRHSRDRRFSFGTGKMGDLAGFSSALLLGGIALVMAYESVKRMVAPVGIAFDQALLVAVLGLVVNLASALLLKQEPHGGHDHEDHGNQENQALAERHQDPNLRAAYLHVVADALTSVLAIAALLVGKMWGWTLLDPIMGVVGALLIGRWSWGLMRDSGKVLLDYTGNPDLVQRIRDTVLAWEGTQILDLHVWRLGPGHYGAIVAVTTDSSFQVEEVKKSLYAIEGVSHVTVELHAADEPDAAP